MAGVDHDHRAAQGQARAAVALLDADRRIADEAIVRRDERAELGLVPGLSDHLAQRVFELVFVCRLPFTPAARLLGPGFGFWLVEVNFVLDDAGVEETLRLSQSLEAGVGLVVPGRVGSVFRGLPSVEGGIAVRVVLGDDRIAHRNVEGVGG